MRCNVALVRMGANFSAYGLARLTIVGHVSTTGAFHAEHAPPRPGHTPRIWTAALLRGPTYYIGDVSFGPRTWSGARTRRGSSVSATGASPRSMSLRVVGPQCHILGSAYFPWEVLRARATWAMARWVIEKTPRRDLSRNWALLRGRF